MTSALETQWTPSLFSLMDLIFFFLNVGDFCEIFAYNKSISSVENLNSFLSVQRALPAWPGDTYVSRLWDSLPKARVVGHPGSWGAELGAMPSTSSTEFVAGQTQMDALVLSCVWTACRHP